MLDKLFQPIFENGFTAGGYLICTLASLLLGAAVAWAAVRKSAYTKGFVLTLVLIPAVVQTVIMLVNGSVGMGIAVAGAFSLVRFRSVPGTAREIAALFSALGIGLATATGYIGIAVLFALTVCAVMVVISVIRFPNEKGEQRELKITVPESLNCSGAFTDIFEKYTESAKLVSVKTTSMGSLFKLHYRVVMKKCGEEQNLINELRCRNGNLEIAVGVAEEKRDEL